MTDLELQRLRQPAPTTETTSPAPSVAQEIRGEVSVGERIALVQQWLDEASTYLRQNFVNDLEAGLRRYDQNFSLTQDQKNQLKSRMDSILAPGSGRLFIINRPDIDSLGTYFYLTEQDVRRAQPQLETVNGLQDLRPGGTVAVNAAQMASSEDVSATLAHELLYGDLANTYLREGAAGLFARFQQRDSTSFHQQTGDALPALVLHLL